MVTVPGFTEKIKERVFKIVLVKGKHGTDIAQVEKPDQTVTYNGKKAIIKIGEN